MMNADTIDRRRGRVLIPDGLFGRLAARIAAERPDIDQAMAGRIMDQALAFLAAAGTHGGERLSPTTQVDIGWHTFILYTREYAEFCDRVAGRFIHHAPHDDTPDRTVEDAGCVARTLAAIETAGYTTDPGLWTVTAKCSDCSASGKDGNENTDSQIPPPLD
jgi:hypothetical protein